MLLDIKCEQCGADLKYQPGTETLQCDYCNNHIEFDISQVPIAAHEEIALEHYLQHYDEQNEQIDCHVVTCQACGAETQLEENHESGICPFCATALIVEQRYSKKLIKPKGILPFQVEREEAKASFKHWVKFLWFAPSDLEKQASSHDRFRGIYLPYWTYDCDTCTYYTGRRGDYYYETETYTDSEGKQSTRQVRYTSWYSVSGQVSNNFDDVLVPATRSLTRDKLYALEPWDLNEAVDYKAEYLSGYATESYQVNLTEGYEEAKGIMGRTIEDAICRDIGGDTQEISSTDTRYSNVTFKHLLLPVWVSAYHYEGKLYQVLVNARTGEVQGQRPYSWIKISLAIAIVGGISAYGYFAAKGA